MRFRRFPLAYARMIAIRNTSPMAISAGRDVYATKSEGTLTFQLLCAALVLVRHGTPRPSFLRRDSRTNRERENGRERERVGKTGSNDGGWKSDGGSRGNLKTETIWVGRRDCYSPPFAMGLRSSRRTLYRAIKMLQITRYEWEGISVGE